MSTKALTIMGIVGGIAILAGVSLALFMPRWAVSAGVVEAKGPLGWNTDENPQGNPWNTDNGPQSMGCQSNDCPANQQSMMMAQRGSRQGGMGAQGMGNQGAGHMNWDTAAAQTPLLNTEADALQQAILEEYGALNLYQAVIDQFGAAMPFTQIVRSEQQHINALLRQADIFDVEAPTNPGLAEAPSFETLADACQAGVQAEIADAALYDELYKVTTNENLLRVFERLQGASLNSHLPAFEVCQ